MKNTVVWILVGLNVVLLAMFIGRVSAPNVAHAQQARRPGDYLLIPAEVQGGQAGVVFLMDTTSGELSAIALDENARRLVAMPRLNVPEIFAAGVGGPAPREPSRR